VVSLRKLSLWLAGIAAIITLGHLLGSQDLHAAVDAATHAEIHLLDGSDAPADDGSECGSAVSPASCTFAPAETGPDIPPDSVRPLASSDHSLGPNGRSPPDTVALLQVNRV
jgi:hypothetical protein